MIGKLMRRYALTRQGAIDFIKCTAITTLQNIMLMVPVALMYYLAADLINGTVPANHRYTYIAGCVIILVVFGVVFFYSIIHHSSPHTGRVSTEESISRRSFVHFHCLFSERRIWRT